MIHQTNMWCHCYLLIFLMYSCSAQIYTSCPVIDALLGAIGIGGGGGWACGPCPAADCRVLPAVYLGYCCGCALPIDRVPIFCPYNLLCPPPSPELCRDYDYLLDCCC